MEHIATIVNSTPAQPANNGMGFFLGIVLLIFFVVLLLMYGVPYIQRNLSNGTQINIPDHVNVNVQQPGSGK